MRRRAQIQKLLLALALAALPWLAQAGELYVVVNAKNPLRNLAPREVVALFTGRVHAFPDGQEAEPVDQGDANGTRAAFYQTLTGMDLARINSYWARLRFSGQVQPPPQLADDREVIALARQNPRVIGYVRSPPTDPGVRVVLVLSEPAN